MQGWCTVCTVTHFTLIYYRLKNVTRHVTYILCQYHISITPTCFLNQPCKWQAQASCGLYRMYALPHTALNSTQLNSTQPRHWNWPNHWASGIHGRSLYHFGHHRTIFCSSRGLPAYITVWLNDMKALASIIMWGAPWSFWHASPRLEHHIL
jgi:hypothetical protein